MEIHFHESSNYVSGALRNFRRRGGFCKLGYKSLAVLKVKIMTKRIPSSLNIFSRKNKRCYVYLVSSYNWPTFTRDHQTVTIMNQCCYCFDGLWKVKAKYKILCLNALAKLQKNCQTCSHMHWPYQSTK